MNETNHPSSLATCTLIQDFLGVKDGGIYEAVVKQKQRLDAVVAENVALKEFIKKEYSGTMVRVINDDGSAGWDCIDCSPRTPETNAALAEVEAKAIEKFADTIGEMYQHEKPTTAKAKAFKHVVFLAVNYAQQLREGRV